MTAEHVDVLIIGGGLSGVGAACHVREQAPQKSIAILEARGAMGGTWDLFRYPGIRSDSDMFTLGYSFRPWKEAKAIADGPDILRYIEDTARDHRIDERIRYHHRAVAAAWSTADARWTVDAERTDTGESVQLTCSFLLVCTGYYRYDEGYTPEFAGTERFGGEIIHPQHWPEDLEYAGKRVVVIGSGATAVTLVPAMAETATHVTMLQRSPSYILTLPGRDIIADALRKLLPDKLAYALVRRKNVWLASANYRMSRKRPRAMSRIIRRFARMQLPKGYDVDTHFNPPYAPWDQRLCLVPDGDLFKTIRRGKASIVTDRIETFTERGLQLGSGEELEADVIITATGLNLLLLGGLAMTVDGAPIEPPETVGYKGMMLSGVPNLAMTVGYTNASWTLKCDLVCEYACRLINHMDAHGYSHCVPGAPDASVPLEPFINLTSGYVQRSIHTFPKQAATTPWRLHQDYKLDLDMLRNGALEDGVMTFARATAPADERETVLI